MRLAGTCKRYSNNATPQLASAATYQARPESSLRWAYQAKVMKTFDAISRSTVRTSMDESVDGWSGGMPGSEAGALILTGTQAPDNRSRGSRLVGRGCGRHHSDRDGTRPVARARAGRAGRAAHRALARRLPARAVRG